MRDVKHYLWHGSSAQALENLEDLDTDLDTWGCDEDGEKQPQADSAAAARMLTYVRELATYITTNAAFIVNYGERYRNGERISTAFTESTVNQVVSKRMVKKQQMQWTPESAHLLLQVRTQVLNDEWDDTFRTWYPTFRPVQTVVAAARAACPRRVRGRVLVAQEHQPLPAEPDVHRFDASGSPRVPARRVRSCVRRSEIV